MGGSSSVLRTGRPPSDNLVSGSAAHKSGSSTGDVRAVARYTERRRISQKVSPSRATETNTSQPVSIHWKVQYRPSGWYVCISVYPRSLRYAMGSGGAELPLPTLADIPSSDMETPILSRTELTSERLTCVPSCIQYSASSKP